jgi:tRNA-guanine family transglycosylase
MLCKCAGTVKGLTNDMLRAAKCHLILGNTYHLANQPGAQTVETLGGLHEFISWDRAMLTDSGALLSDCCRPSSMLR